MRVFLCVVVISCFSAFAIGEDDPARWVPESTTEHDDVTLAAGGISGPVGYVGEQNGWIEEAGTSEGEYGTDISGSIGTTSADDTKTKDNALTQKWVWFKGSPPKSHQSGTVTAEITQDPSGSGTSSIQYDGNTQQWGYLASSYTSKLHQVTYAPTSGTTTSDGQLSLDEELNNNDSYSVSETVTHWRRDINVAQSDDTVQVTAKSRAQGVVNGELCTVDQELKLKLTLDLPEPPGVEEEEE